MIGVLVGDGSFRSYVDIERRRGQLLPCFTQAGLNQSDIGGREFVVTVAVGDIQFSIDRASEINFRQAANRHARQTIRLQGKHDSRKGSSYGLRGFQSGVDGLAKCDARGLGSGSFSGDTYAAQSSAA